MEKIFQQFIRGEQVEQSSILPVKFVSIYDDLFSEILCDLVLMNDVYLTNVPHIFHSQINAMLITNLINDSMNLIHKDSDLTLLYDEQKQHEPELSQMNLPVLNEHMFKEIINYLQHAKNETPYSFKLMNELKEFKEYLKTNGDSINLNDLYNKLQQFYTSKGLKTRYVEDFVKTMTYDVLSPGVDLPTIQDLNDSDGVDINQYFVKYLKE